MEVGHRKVEKILKDAKLLLELTPQALIASFWLRKRSDLE